MSDKKIKARVIAQHPDHEIDDIVMLTAEEAKAADWADADPAAVKYAESLGKAPVAADAEGPAEA